MEKEKQLLRQCCLQIEQALNWGDNETWSNDDFEHLSEKIFEKTRVRLSISTLKRIWGKVRYENTPTTATLNALAGFLGYDSWREFRQKNDTNGLHAPAHREHTLPEFVAAPLLAHKSRRYNQLIALFSVAVIVLAVVFLVSKKIPPKVDLSKIKFEAVKVSDTLPNSVIFNYDASAFQSDSVYIQQSWDPRRRERVDAYGKQHTSIYYNPGYFIAKLIVDNQIKKECIVNIQTKGWKGIIERDPVPTYLSPKESRDNGMMGISASTLQQKTGSPVFNEVWVKFAVVHEFKNIDPGNFTFEASVRNTSSVEASICRRINAIILLRGGAIILPLCDKGCISNINLLTGEYWISGKEHDLSAFGCDFSKFQDLKCVVANHRFRVYLNNKLVINAAQKNALGGIAGIRFEFEGAGQVKDVSLSTPGGGKYYQKFDSKDLVSNKAHSSPHQLKKL
ncbi:MAG TPA: hypothetical protein VFE53_13695 [Mucilaginibacter sp.]|jgi:hypothetical protein|nr:hypothetical protein [Mucilaginibacter sp.]